MPGPLLIVLQVTGEGILVAFNPITGEGVGEGGGVMPLGYTLIQALLLHHPDHQYLKVGVQEFFIAVLEIYLTVDIEKDLIWT